jgi:TRAP-type mannitol/chloroaromatic compound transport system permease small subunit
MGMMAYMCWPYFLKVLTTGEMSQNAGGLIRCQIKKTKKRISP